MTLQALPFGADDGGYVVQHRQTVPILDHGAFASNAGTAVSLRAAEAAARPDKGRSAVVAGLLRDASGFPSAPEFSTAADPGTDKPAPDGAGRWLRALDVILSSLALLVFLPLMLVIALAVFVSDGGPILFHHRRIGAGGRHFACLKFRSMVVDADARLRTLLAMDDDARAEWIATQKLQNDPRVTVVGRFLRKSSLDELPQLINVWLGDMSLVGPRPIVDSEIARYGRHFAAYCVGRPGLTGLWQVVRSRKTSYRRRVACDVVYRRSCSVRLYLRILLLTPPSVVLAKGAF